jgi:lipopolysaccharide/colanic/teichoic acid biosynthesis glycosyltransferase
VNDLVRGTGNARVKHALDRVLAGSALVVFSPVMLAIAAWIRLETGPPVLFSQPRVGRNGRVFRMHKFRTMVQNAIALNRERTISDDPFGHLPDDPRITRSGRFLRRTSLDELPQLVNVVRGEMSLVGPRADIVEQVANYTDSDRRRLAVKPGITGWAQVNGRDSIPWPKRFELDAWYVENWSLALDARIVLMTVLDLFRERPEPVVDEMNIARAKAREQQ